MARPVVASKTTKDPYWIAGFASGDGSFMVNIFESKTTHIGFAVKLSFKFSQHSRDKELMKSFRDYWGCGRYCFAPELNYNHGEFIVSSLSDIVEKIVPFFRKYPIIGEKSKDFIDFCEISSMMIAKDHLALQGLERIKKIKDGMNSRRDSNSSERSSKRSSKRSSECSSQEWVYKVSSIKDILNVIIPHFYKFPLVTQKRADFEIFKQIIIILSKGPLLPENLTEVINLKAVLNKGLSAALKLAFPEKFPFNRPEIPFKGIPDPFWVCGFSEGEGSFVVSLSENSRYKTGITFWLGFILTQHSRDQALLEGLKSFFGSSVGNVFLRKDKLAVDYKVTRVEDLTEKIIPFFKQYRFIGSKSISFKRFYLAAHIIKAKGHLTKEGLKKIRDIKSQYND